MLAPGEAQRNPGSAEAPLLKAPEGGWIEGVSRQPRVPFAVGELHPGLTSAILFGDSARPIMSVGDSVTPFIDVGIR